MSAVFAQKDFDRCEVDGNVWFCLKSTNQSERLTSLPVNKINYEVLPTEEAIGKAMFDEIKRAALSRQGDLVITILGGRGAQALHRFIGQVAESSDEDYLIGRLHIFTQDALAPMNMNNGFSFVRDFERLLGEDFFRKVKSFNTLKTDATNLEGEITAYIEKLESLGGIDIFFLGLGPEADAASHLAYIKPNSGATVNDLAGFIPISPSILEHHIAKFKAGGSVVSDEDEKECRSATHILTLGPAAILGAKRIVQSIVDADTAPAKRECYKRFLEEEISDDPGRRAEQLNENPGLLLRLHPNVRSLILPDVLTA